MEKLDRQDVKILKAEDQSHDSAFMPGSMAERFSVVWDLTQDLWAFMTPQDAEQRLQRHVAVLTRRRG